MIARTFGLPRIRSPDWDPLAPIVGASKPIHRVGVAINGRLGVSLNDLTIALLAHEPSASRGATTAPRNRIIRVGRPPASGALDRTRWTLARMSQRCGRFLHSSSCPTVADQPSPWERAGCTQAAWLRLFDRLTAEWIAAAHAVRIQYPSPDDPGPRLDDPGEIRRTADVASDIAADWRSAIDGEGPTVRSLLQRYRIDPRAR
jgi:hypothetical protein